MTKKFKPIRETLDYSYSVREVVEYIYEAYGVKVNKSKVVTNYESMYVAVEKLGYELEEADYHFPNPETSLPKFPLGTKVVEIGGGVGVVVDISGASYSVRGIIGWKSFPYCSWWEEDDLQELSILL